MAAAVADSPTRSARMRTTGGIPTMRRRSGTTTGGQPITPSITSARPPRISSCPTSSTWARGVAPIKVSATPASCVSRRPIAVRIGAVRTGSQAVSHALAPPPSVTGDELHALLHGAPGESVEETASEPARAVPLPSNQPAIEAEELISRISSHAESAAPPTRMEDTEVESTLYGILVEMAAEPDCTFRSAAALFQDFSSRCRRQRISTLGIDISQFRRRFAMALAGVGCPPDEGWSEILGAGQDVPEDLLAPFLLMARAAQQCEPCPEDEELGRIYGTNSPGRIRRLLEFLEKSGFIVVRTDFSGRLSITIPALGTATAPLDN